MDLDQKSLEGQSDQGLNSANGSSQFLCFVLDTCIQKSHKQVFWQTAKTMQEENPWNAALHHGLHYLQGNKQSTRTKIHLDFKAHLWFIGCSL